mmetsp:Transcript_69004/g.140305  ORF Transcript_69004/g.140305 Transcript_69004/m.140305 type:complete len:143 (-) Transcript_69004:97-525(-)
MHATLAAAALALLVLAPQQGAAAAALRRSNSGEPVTPATALAAGGEAVAITSHQFMEVTLGPFGSEADACDYCFSSFTKEGVPPAGPVAPACVCMAYPDDGSQFNMFCATPAAAAGYVAEKGGCRCKERDMEHMAATTCEKI